MLNENNQARQRDQYYTQSIVAEECFEILKSEFKIEDFLWLEPSAGTGAFTKILEDNKCLYVAYDIEPKNRNIILKDFLTLSASDIKISLPNYESNLFTIGNPPFGKNANLAINFFNHAANYSEYIAMILPATFEKESIQKRLHPHMHLITSKKIDNNLFIFDNQLVKVPTVFQIWKKDKDLVKKFNTMMVSQYFTFVKKEEADFAIQRVGAAAGKVKDKLENLPISSHYFIKSEQNIKEVFRIINWDKVKYNTAGNPSISKKELIVLLEKYLNSK